MASFYADLPLGIDERQVVETSRPSLRDGLSLRLARAAREQRRRPQNFSFWRTLILTTGEEPITAETSNAGVRTRTLELWGNPIESEQDARLLHELSNEHFGYAGPEFIVKLINYDRVSLKEQFKTISDGLRTSAPDKGTSHLDALSAGAG